MATRWTYPVTGLDGAPVHDNLPLLCEGFSDSLGLAGGALTGTVSLVDAPGDLDDVIAPLRRLIWPCADGTPVGCYLVTGESEFDQEATGVGVLAESVDSVLLERRTLNDTLIFGSDTAPVESLEVARDLWRYALGRPTVLAYSPRWGGAAPVKLNADLPFLDLGDEVSGNLMYRGDNKDGWQASGAPLADILGKLMQLEGNNGHEYRRDHFRDSDGSLRMRIRFGSPQVGSPTPVMVWESGPAGGNMRWSRAVAGDQAANQVSAWGAGEAAVQTTASVTSEPGPYPLLEVGITESSVSRQDTLTAKAQARLTGLTSTWQATVDLPMTAYSLGDRVMLRVRHPRFGPRPLNVIQRVVGRRVVPGGAGRGTVITPILAGA